MNYAFDQNLNEYSPHGYKNEQFLKKMKQMSLLLANICRISCYRNFL